MLFFTCLFTQNDNNERIDVNKLILLLVKEYKSNIPDGESDEKTP
jgi:hypothetical protein